MSILSQASGSHGYSRASRLRQAQDYQWLLADFADVGSVADLGCGSGGFLHEVLTSFPRIEYALGIDQDEYRLTEARRTLAEMEQVTVKKADLLNLPALDHRFDVIAAMSVLHWLYPHETILFDWVRTHLALRGSFLVTTYHPDTDDSGFGGTDHLVTTALARLGITDSDVAELFAAHGIIPMATRTRHANQLHVALAHRFDIVDSEQRRATMRVSDSIEYQRYHAATFGSYYSRVIPVDFQQDFFTVLGDIATERMSTFGFVTDISIKRWRCSYPRYT